MITQFQAICIMEISDLVYLDREILGIFRQTGTLKGLLSENFQSCFSKFRQKESFGKLLSEKTEVFFSRNKVFGSFIVLFSDKK